MDQILSKAGAENLESTIRLIYLCVGNSRARGTTLEYPSALPLGGDAMVLRHRNVRAISPRSGLALLLGAALAFGALPLSASAAAITPVVRPRTSATVTADALPTVQIDGVVWTQVMIGNTVYAGGEFTTARPAGAALGTSQTPRRNLLAYDITSGKLSTKFVPGAFNGAIRALATSADKKTLYVGGSFTKVGKVVRGRFAALNASTGALKSPNPSFNGIINAFAVNSKNVYAGGLFSAVNNSGRARLASIGVKSGKLTRWKAVANSGVNALLLTPGSKMLVIGGSFTKLNSTAASGSGAVSPATGKTKTWKVNKVVKNGGSSSAILSLASDGSTVYGAGFTYGTGNFEGVFAASSKDGTLRWLQDCHGDTYGVLPLKEVVYSVGHAHYCSNIGGFPDTSDYTKSRTTWYRALAVTRSAAGSVAKNGQKSSKSYMNFEGRPAPALLNWFPDLTPGSFTGMSQAAWSVVGNGSYVSLGGEFPKVNGKPQQGLVRMAIAKVAPNGIGPSGNAEGIALSAAVRDNGKIVISWNQLWDRDDLELTYQLFRNGRMIDARAVSVPFWQRSGMTFVDSDAVSHGSSTAAYQVIVSDPSGNAVSSSTLSVALPSEPSVPPVNDHPSVGPSPFVSEPEGRQDPASSWSATTPSASPSATGTDLLPQHPMSTSSATAAPSIRPSSSGRDQ